MIRFAGDAYNKIVPYLDRGRQNEVEQIFRKIAATPEEETWHDDSWRMTPLEQARSDAKEHIWKQIRSDEGLGLNVSKLIADNTLPGSYDEAANAYRHAILNEAMQRLSQGKWTGNNDLKALGAKERAWLVKQNALEAYNAAKVAVDPRAFGQGVPSQVSFLRQYLEAAQNPQVRRLMDLPENGEDEWGVLLSPVEAIQEYQRIALNAAQKRSSQDDDLEPF